tara:strand:+ start:343 stop:687 length:345 start_codon:yes stop_codon:yes gene_type:complete
MKKILIFSILLFCILPLTPWWCIGLLLGFNGWVSTAKKEAAISGGTIAAIAWILPLIWHYFSGGRLLMDRVGGMIDFAHPLLLVLVSLILIVIMGMLSSLSGYFSRRIFNEPSF